MFKVEDAEATQHVKVVGNDYDLVQQCLVQYAVSAVQARALALLRAASWFYDFASSSFRRSSFRAILSGSSTRNCCPRWATCARGTTRPRRSRFISRGRAFGQHVRIWRVSARATSGWCAVWFVR